MSLFYTARESYFRGWLITPQGTGRFTDFDNEMYAKAFPHAQTAINATWLA